MKGGGGHGWRAIVAFGDWSGQIVAMGEGTALARNCRSHLRADTWAEAAIGYSSVAVEMEPSKMLLGFGWAVIQASRSRLVGAPFEQLDALDHEIDRQDQALRADCRDWLERCDDPWLRWQFSDQLNNHGGLLQFHTSRNHRTSAFWELASFIADQSVGSYGALYVHDDEDDGVRLKGQDFSLSLRVWRILEGELSEHDDHLFSPFRSPHAFGGEGGFGE